MSKNDTELLGYTDSTVTVRVGEDINVYDDDVGNLIKTTENKAVLRRLLASLTRVDPRLRCLYRHSRHSLTYLIANVARTDNRLESCLASNKTPKFKIDKSIFKPKAIKPVKNAYTAGDTSHTQQTMRDAKQRDTEKRAKGIAKQKAILKAKMIKLVLSIISTLILYAIFLFK